MPGSLRYNAGAVGSERTWPANDEKRWGAEIMRKIAGFCTIGVAVLVAGIVVGPVRAFAEEPSCGPSFSDTGPDADAYGVAQDYPIGTRFDYQRQSRLVGSYSHFDQIFPTRPVTAPAEPSELKRSCDVETWTYAFGGKTRTVDDYLQRNPTTGLLIAKDSTILLERYQYGRTDRDRFTSASMAKTILSMLIGIAKDEGKIHSLDDLAETYVPGLQGSAYGETSLRSLLTMSSGVAFSETYDDKDDLAKMGRGLRRGADAATLLSKFNTRQAPQGTRFAYASSESEVLGLVLRAAVGETLSDYASEKLWKPMGAEADANWSTDKNGQEMTYCCFDARLRDYARLALVLARDGDNIIPKSWVLEATSADPNSYLAPKKATPFWGYGYQTWLLPARRRMFALRGIHGQTIFVDPESHLVLVHTAVRTMASNDPSVMELNALWFALVQQLGTKAADAQN
jgi:CubicO group peptidase (beta-lactamase class C family)